jgi:hypothetical protein
MSVVGCKTVAGFATCFDERGFTKTKCRVRLVVKQVPEQNNFRIAAFHCARLKYLFWEHYWTKRKCRLKSICGRHNSIVGYIAIFLNIVK